MNDAPAWLVVAVPSLMCLWMAAAGWVGMRMGWLR